MVFSHNKQHLQSLQTRGAPLPAGSEQTDADCCIYCGLNYFGVGWILQVCLLVICKTRKVLIRTWRSSLDLARTSACAMVFAATRLLIALPPRAAALVLSRRSAGKWN